MSIDTAILRRCLQTIERAQAYLDGTDPSIVALFPDSYVYVGKPFIASCCLASGRL